VLVKRGLKLGKRPKQKKGEVRWTSILAELPQKRCKKLLKSQATVKMATTQAAVQMMLCQIVKVEVYAREVRSHFEIDESHKERS